MRQAKAAPARASSQLRAVSHSLSLPWPVWGQPGEPCMGWGMSGIPGATCNAFFSKSVSQSQARTSQLRSAQPPPHSSVKKASTDLLADIGGDPFAAPQAVPAFAAFPAFGGKWDLEGEPSYDICTVIQGIRSLWVTPISLHMNECDRRVGVKWVWHGLCLGGGGS